MKTLDTTNGEWHNTLTGIKSDKGLLIAQCWCGQDNDSFGRIPAVTYSEMGQNEKLIADAGTTYNKCELLPSELLAQKDELLKMLKETAKFIDECGAQAGVQKMLDDIESVIKKHTL